MSLHALRSPAFPPPTHPSVLFAGGRREAEASKVVSPSRPVSFSQDFHGGLAGSTVEVPRAVSDARTSNSDGGEQDSKAECTLPYLLLSEALAGLPATFNTKASDKACFYSFSDTVSQQRRPASFVDENSNNVGEIPINDVSTDTGRSAPIANDNALQEAFSSLFLSRNANLCTPRSDFPDSGASTAVVPVEEAFGRKHNHLDSAQRETAVDKYLSSLERRDTQQHSKTKTNGPQTSEDLAIACREPLVRDPEQNGANAQFESPALPQQHQARSAVRSIFSKERGGTTETGQASSYVPRPEELERIAYVIRGFGLSSEPSLPTGPRARQPLSPRAGLRRSRENEALSGHDLAQFIGRRHTLPGKGPLELPRLNQISLPTDRVVHRRHSGPFLLPVFPFCDSDGAALASAGATTTPCAVPKQLEASSFLKHSVYSEQPRDASGNAESLRRSQTDEGSADQAKYTLIVNVPPTTTRQDLYLTFSVFGVVELTVVVCDKDHRHPNKEWTATSGYAFVRFSKTEEAAAAVAAAALGTVRLRGSRVRATWAKKDSIPKHATGGNVAAGCSRSTKGRPSSTEPGMRAQTYLCEQVEDPHVAEEQQRQGTAPSALDRSTKNSAFDILAPTYFKVPLALCLTPKSAQEFACHMCRTYLAADPVVLPCWHLFCNDCLQQWKSRCTMGGDGYRCPTCGMWTATAHEKRMDEVSTATWGGASGQLQMGLM